MRLAIGSIVLFAAFAASALAADEKIDVKKLLGKWEPAGDAKSKTAIEFAAEGKLIVTGDANLTGTWKLTGNVLALTFAAGENETKDTVTIVKLTDDELAVEDAKKEKKRTFKRVK